MRRDADCIVRTSDRRDGRAGGGMAAELHRLETGDAALVRVAHPRDVAWQYRGQAIARDAYSTGRLDLIAATVGLSHDHVEGVARDCPNAEAFAMRIVPVPEGGMRIVSLGVAEAELEMLSRLRVAA